MKTGVKIIAFRFTKKGEIVIELQTGAEERIAEFAAKVQTALGKKAEVRRRQRKMMLSILGIEASATVNEITMATGVESEAKVLNLSTMGRGCQTARMQVPISEAVELLKKEEIVIGWSHRRVRSLKKKENHAR